jgi:hypothetical protein
MDVPGYGDRFYIGFLEKPDKLEARFNTGDRWEVYLRFTPDGDYMTSGTVGMVSDRSSKVNPTRRTKPTATITLYIYINNWVTSQNDYGSQTEVVTNTRKMIKTNLTLRLYMTSVSGLDVVIDNWITAFVGHCRPNALFKWIYISLKSFSFYIYHKYNPYYLNSFQIL